MEAKERELYPRTMFKRQNSGINYTVKQDIDFREHIKFSIWHLKLEHVYETKNVKLVVEYTCLKTMCNFKRNVNLSVIGIERSMKTIDISQHCVEKL